MASTHVTLTANTWVQITDGEREGFINHQSGTKQVVYTVSETEPVGFSSSSFIASKSILGENVSFYGLRTGQNVYAYCIDGDATLTLSPADGSMTILKNMTTDENYKLARLKVDSQQTSYEQNYQFKVFHRLISVPATTQAVFKFEATNPVNIQERKINLWNGGREYLVVPDTGQYPTLDAKLTIPVDITAVNGNTEDSGLPSHPESGVTVTLGLLTGADIITIGNNDQFPNGDAVKVDSSGGSNKGNNQPLSTPNKSGVKRDQSFYLIFTDIAGVETSGHFYLQWEERF